MRSLHVIVAVGLGLLLNGCGGTVVVDDDGSGGDGSGASTASSPSTSSGQPQSSGTSSQASSTGTTTAGCSFHDDCGGSLCQFGTGICVAPCGADGECPDGFICDFCATSSCPGCRDCVAACVPGSISCATHDDCGGNLGENVCVFATGQCAQRCGGGSPPCPPGFGCDDCATSSCPMCADCLGACK